MRKTKIVCTIGPACYEKETMLKMIDAGMNVARINMSHGDYGVLEGVFATIKEAIAESGKNVAIMLDTKGPEVRVGTFKGGAAELKEGSEFTFYKEKDDAIIDLAHSLKKEVDAIENKVKPVYIQVDEPFLSTGMVNMKVAREAIDILHDGLNIPLAMHVCGTLEGAYKDIAKFNVEILDFEFAGNNVNLDILENNIDLFKGKKIGFGCIDSAKNEVDSFETTQELIEKGVNIVGVDDILLDPDCGLRRAPMDVAFNKLKLINDIKSKYQ